MLKMYSQRGNIQIRGKYVSEQQDVVRNERCCRADNNGEKDGLRE
jgi:hypothetical protein